LGYPPDKKYERDGGPGMAACLQLLAGSADADVDRLAFQLSQLVFWLMAATDGHVKNFSLFLQQGDAYAMTPLYDVISIWPYIGDGAHQFRWRSAGLAMALRARNVHYALHTLSSASLACPGDEERRPAGVASDARTGRSGRLGPRHRRVAPSAVLSGADLGGDPGPGCDHRHVCSRRLGASLAAKSPAGVTADSQPMPTALLHPPPSQHLGLPQ
jgi:hypothetical protein